jgi:gamma-glutamylcyclotransferase (GGCT)/AIG2-like uncharacterized protein YtfP
MALIFLNGGAMRGGNVHHLLKGAPMVAVVRTAPKYRFYSVGDAFPALEWVTEGGVSVVGELYDVPWDVLENSVLPGEPAELELGVIELENGTGTLSMIRRRTYTEPDTYKDISEHADWNAYQAALKEPKESA